MSGEPHLKNAARDGAGTTPAGERRDKPLSKRSGRVVGVLLFAAVVVGLLIIARQPAVQAALKTALGGIAGLGFFGYVLFVLLYIGACVLLLPGVVLTLGAGFVFGVVKGAVVVSIGATLGATSAFLVGRYLARDWVAGRFAGSARFQAVDQAVGREGWKIVFLTRLSPLFPYNLLNYAFGLTSVRLKHYFFASWAGMIPGTVMYVYLGSLAGDLATLGAGERQRGALEWALYGLGLVATVAVTVFVTRLARRALAARISS